MEETIPRLVFGAAERFGDAPAIEDEGVVKAPEGDDTVVTIHQEMRGQAVGFSIGTGVYLLVALLMGVVNLLGTGEDVPPIGVAIMFLMMAVVFFGGVQIGTRVHARKQRGKFERALDRIELLAREALPVVPEGEASQATRETADASRTPEIDLDALPEPGDVASQNERSSRTRS